jgi:hypothetical protein
VNRAFPGEFVHSFSDANNPTDVQTAIKKVEAWFKEKLTHKQAKNAPRPIQQPPPAPLSAGDKYLDQILKSDRSILERISLNFTLETGSGNSQGDLVPLLQLKAVRSSLVDVVLFHLQGWVKAKIDTLIEAGNNATISVDEFLQELSSYYRRVDVQTALNSTAPIPSNDQLQSEFSRIFVQQLDLIDLEVDDKLRAVENYLRSSYDRVQWGVAGDVNSTSFDEFQRDLLDYWDIRRKTVKLDHPSEPPVLQGQRVYLGCRDCNKQLQGMATPTHFVQGSFHDLAEQLRLGWHPDYKTKLKKNGRGK